MVTTREVVKGWADVRVDKLFTTGEAMTLLRCSRPHLWSLDKAGKLVPACRPGGRKLYLGADLLLYAGLNKRSFARTETKAQRSRRAAADWAEVKKLARRPNGGSA